MTNSGLASRPAARMTERQLQDAILQLCKLLGLLAYHTHDSRRSQPGFPDLAICGPSGLLLRELKADHGYLTTAQADWGQALRHAQADWDVWRPADLRSGRIAGELQAINRRRNPPLRERRSPDAHLAQ